MGTSEGEGRAEAWWRVPLLVLVCAVLWGSAFPGIKYVYGEWGSEVGLEVRLAFAGFRFMLAGLMLVPLRGNPLVAVSSETWRGLVLLALSQTFVQYVLFYTGLAVSGGILGSLLVSAGSFWWVLLAPLILKTPRPTRLQWAGLVLCAVGMALAVWRPGAGAGDPLLGAGCFLGSSFSGAVGVVMMAKLGAGVRPTHATSLSLFSGGVLLALCGVRGWGDFFGLMEVKTTVVTVYLAAVSASAFALWNTLVKQYSANLLAGYRFLIPLSGVVLSAVFIPGEAVGLGTFLGGLLVVGAVVVVNRRRGGRMVERK
ncbi:MAG: DMT family transporter [Verrucomicrobiales bacterium]|nr:DMT family transporter [Verrucomicrobiales bacterium]